MPRRGWPKNSPKKTSSLRTAAREAGVRAPATVYWWLHKDMSPSAVQARLSQRGRKAAVTPELRDEFSTWFDEVRGREDCVKQSTVRDWFLERTGGTLKLSNPQISQLVATAGISSRVGQVKKAARYAAEVTGEKALFLRDLERRGLKRKSTFVMDEKSIRTVDLCSAPTSAWVRRCRRMEPDTNKRDTLLATLAQMVRNCHRSG